MREEARRMKCDVCGKKTEWKQNDPAPDNDLIGWRRLNLKGAQYAEEKDYCSKECAFKDLEDVY